MFVSEEEAHHLVEQSGLGAQKFKLLRMPDIPEGDNRYIMCSKQVSDDVLARLNKAITMKKKSSR